MKNKKILILLAILLFCSYSSADNLEEVLDNKLTNKINEYSNKLTRNISNNLKKHDRIKYFDFSMNFQENHKPTIEIQSVNKLSESKNGSFFNQTNLLSHDGDTTINLGFGKRKLINNDSLLLGSNFFLDYQFNESHLRNGIGVEAISDKLDLRGNYYNAISGFKQVDNGTEKALDGYDIQLDLHVKDTFNSKTDLFIQTFEWKNPNSTFKEKGEKAGIISQIGNFALEVGYLNDNKNNDGFFGGVKLVIPLGDVKEDKNKKYSSKDKQLNLRDKLFIPVKRENKIKVVKLSSGVKIGGF